MNLAPLALKAEYKAQRKVSRFGIWLCLSACFISGVGCNTKSAKTKLNVTATDKHLEAKVHDWPALYGPQHNSISLETKLKLDFDEDGPPLLWRIPIGLGFSAPIVADGKVIINSRIGDEEVVKCISLESGDEIWQHRYPTNFVCQEDSYSSAPYSTPAIANDRVVVVSANGEFRCLNMNNGQQIWRRDLIAEYEVAQKSWPIASSPLIIDDQIVFNLGAQSQTAGMISLNAQTGETRWTATQKDYCHATPIAADIYGERLIFAMVGDGLVCLTDQGELRFEIEHKQRAQDAYHSNAVAPAVWGNKVCITAGPRVSPGFRCFEIQPDGNYTEPWKNIRLLNTQYTNLVVVGGFLFGFTSPKAGGPELVCIDLTTGEHAWKAKPGIGRGNLLAVQERLLILGEDGNLAAFELNSDQAIEVWRTSKPILNRPCYTSMALSNGLLLARNEKELVCLSLIDSDANE